jgi:hypothetical protein
VKTTDPADLAPMRPSALGRRLRACVRALPDEQGVALVMALGLMMVLTLALGTVIYLTAAGARDAQRTNAGQKAYALAEAGINNSLAVLNANYPGEYPGNSALLPARTTTYLSGSVTWSGTLATAPLGVSWNQQWNLTATSSVKNPTGPGTSPLRRTITAVVPVVQPDQLPAGSNNPLNFIYAFQDLTFPQSTTIASPVYTQRDLILQNSSQISEWIGNSCCTKNKVAVARDLYLTQPGNQIGHVNGLSDPTNDLAEVYVGDKCSTKALPVLHACLWGALDKIWAVTTGNVIPAGFLSYTPELTCCAPYPDVATLAPTAPSGSYSDMGRAYLNADIGPRHGCATGSTNPPFTFDGSGAPDGQLNNSATPNPSAAIDLTPATSYDCRSYNGRGQLAWNSTTKKLTVKGTIFIDGSATISSGASQQATYSGGLATLYLTGTFLMKNTLMCVKTTGTGTGTKCDTSAGAWDPNAGALLIIADGDGGYDTTQNQNNGVAAGQGISLKGASFQGALVSNKDINIDTTSLMQGPMISVYHNVTAGQSNTLTFPTILFAPGGGGGTIAPPQGQLLPPQQFGGG